MDSQNAGQGHGSGSGSPSTQKERIQSFEQMKVWQEAHGLVLRIFEVTPRIPPEQQEGLAAVMEKAAIEIPKSIAEGFKRRGSRNKAHYYNIAQSSLEALRYMLILARDRKYEIDYDDLSTRTDQGGRMLDGLIRSMTRTNRGGGNGGGGGGRHRRGGRRDDQRNRGGGNSGNSNNDDAHGDDDDAPSSHHHDDDWDDE